METNTTDEWTLMVRVSAVLPRNKMVWAAEVAEDFSGTAEEWEVGLSALKEAGEVVVTLGGQITRIR